MFNTDLALLILKRIEAEPETWDQETWAKVNSCGSTFCFAGHVTAELGWKPVNLGVLDGHTAWCVNDQGEERRIENVAKEELGIGDVHAGTLFYGGNTLEYLKAQVRAFAELYNGEVIDV